MNLTSVSQVKKLLSEHGLRPKKRLGQNFLIDRNILDKLVDAADIGTGSNVIEIGPGLGVVTQELVHRGARVVCVEADREFEPILRDILPEESGVEIIIEDFLKIDLPKFFKNRGNGRWMVVGNLPYYITTPIIIKLLESREFVSGILMMVQHEVAQRLAAKPGTSDYGAITVFVQFYCEIESVIKASRNVFYPSPDVDSEVVKLTVRDKPAVSVKDEKLFFDTVRAAFGKRRKTLYNALSSSDGLKLDKEQVRSILEAVGVDGMRRGETLSLQEFADISNAMAQQQ